MPNGKTNSLMDDSRIRRGKLGLSLHSELDVIMFYLGYFDEENKFTDRFELGLYSRGQ